MQMFNTNSKKEGGYPVETMLREAVKAFVHDAGDALRVAAERVGLQRDHRHNGHGS